jgi:MYXO-CTERM domain-containing protein
MTDGSGEVGAGDDSGGGCSCRTTGNDAGGLPLLVLGLLLGALLFARRRGTRS